MTIWWLAVVLGSLAACFAGFVWVIMTLRGLQGGHRKGTIGERNKYTDAAEEETSHLFNKEFREELRNHGRLRFESIIEENAMFLQQDLRLTTSQLNEYMKQQIATKLDTEFEAYTKAMQDLQELAKHSLQQAAGEVEQQRAMFTKTLEDDVAKHKAAILQVYQENMAEVVEHYVSQALGEQFDLKTQLPFIIKKMEANKADIIKDMQL